MHYYVMEAMGTFFLMLAVMFSGNPIAVGLMYMAMICIGGHLSGAHCNPAVSLSFFLRNRLTGKGLLFYWVAQILGALIAAGFAYLLSGQVFPLPELPNKITTLLSISVPELLLTYVLCLVILTVVLTSRFQAIRYSGVLQGLTLLAIASIGGLFNPAVALAVVLLNVFVGNTLMLPGVLVVYLVAPLVGAAGAAYKYKYLNPTE